MLHGLLLLLLHGLLAAADAAASSPTTPTSAESDGGGGGGGGGLFFPLSELSLRVPGQLPPGAVLLRVQAMPRGVATTPPGPPPTAPAPAPAGTNASATEAPADATPQQVTYSFRQPAVDGRMLILNSSTGEIRLKEALSRGTGKRQTSVKVLGSTPGTPPVEMRLNITFLPNDGKSIDCDNITQELCLWPEALFEVPENRPPTSLGPLGPPFLARLCPQHRLSYALARDDPGDDHGPPDVEVVPGAGGAWSLRTVSALDREAAGAGAVRGVPVTCTAARAGAVAGAVGTAAATFRLRVLDEDDSPPEASAKAQRTLQVQLNGTRLAKGTYIEGPELSFTDADTLEPNSYTFTVLNDDAGLFLLPECAQDQAEHLGQERTAISCRLEVAKTVDLPRDPYTVVMQVNDTSLIPKAGSISHVDVTINVYAGHAPTTEPSMMNMKVMSTSMMMMMMSMSTTKMSDDTTAANTMTPSMFPSSVMYPSKAKVLKSATAFARVVQPTGPPDVMTDVSTSAQPTLHFWLPEAQMKSPFDITARGGIVYVKNPMALQDVADTITLKIMWNNTKDDKRSGSANVLIMIKNSSSLECSFQVETKMDTPMNSNSTSKDNNGQMERSTNKTENMQSSGGKEMKNDTKNAISTNNLNGESTMSKGSMVNNTIMAKMDMPPLCASQGNMESCTSLCGLGTGAKSGSKSDSTQGCLWIEHNAKSESSRQYSTCTPDISTCPDGICDPLEDMHPGLCPQDCSMMQSTSANGTRGVVGGSGVCTCDATARCTCMPLTTDKQTASTSPPVMQTTLGAEPLNEDSPEKDAKSCGGLCQLFLILISLLIIAAVIAILLWRYKKRHGSLPCPSCPCSSCPLPPCSCPQFCKDCGCKHDALCSWLPKRLQRHPPPAVAPTPSPRAPSDFGQHGLQSIDAHLLPFGYMAPLNQLHPMYK